MSDVTTTTTTTTEPKKGTLDDLVNLIKTIPAEDVQKLRDVLADGQITRDEIPVLTGVGFRNWKTLAAIIVIIATVIGGWVGYVASPKTDADVAALIKAGFDGQSKQLDAIVKAIEAKPAPVDPDKKPSKGAIPDEVSAKVGRLTIIASKETVDQWIVPPGSPCEWDADGKRLTLVPIEAVEFSIGVVTQKGKSLAWCLVKAGVGPKPPPKPDDPPIPPKPVDPAPIPVAGLRVLIVEESWQRDQLTAGQRAIIFGKAFRDLLEAKCVMGPDGKTKEYRIYDKDIATTGESKIWQNAMSRPRSVVPWIVVSNGVTGFEGPLPANVEDAIALVNKYAGVNP